MIKRRFVSNQRSFVKNARIASAGFLAFFVVLFFAPLLASAASEIPTLSGVVEGTGIPMVNLTVFLLNILRIFFGLLGVIAVALLIYGGFIWMTSAGDPGKVEKAQQIIKNTVIGLIIIFSAFAISSFLISWLKGMTGAGTGTTTNIPGGNGDWSRSAIGAGPIQSVYPSPNAVNVPINTRIAVTFKVNIDPASICDLSAGGSYCNGNAVKNVKICEVAATSSDCLEGSAFNAAAFSATAVYQASETDKKTFVFYPSANLGNDDQEIRTFKVVLESGITAVATGKSVFDGLRVNYYNWAFKTNGLLDLTPPEVAKLEIYPNPDNTADTYALGAQATNGSGSVEVTNLSALKLDIPATLNGEPFVGAALSGTSVTKVSGASDIPAGYLKLSTSGFGVNSAAPATISFTIDSNTQGQYITFSSSPDVASVLGVTFSTTGVCSGVARCLPVTDNKQVSLAGSGIVIASGGNFSDAAGSTWSFVVSPAQTGDTVVLANGSEAIRFVFADADWAEQIARQTVGSDGSAITTYYYTVKSATNSASGYLQSLAAAINSRAGSLVSAAIDSNNQNKIIITSKAAGQNSLSLSSDSGALALSGNLSGAARVVSRTALPPGSQPDPYNNSVFTISFTEAVNPINIGKYITVKINGVEAIASTTLSNQYRTLELTGTHPCGVNTCGKTIYCWLDPNTNTAESVPASAEIIAASLKSCVSGNQDSAGNEWCKKFGGTCQAGVDYGRCKAGGLYYSQAEASADGLVDLANNSFNGNFDKAQSAKGIYLGNAQGRSGTGNGQSGQPAYNANDGRHFDGLAFSFANDGDASGDNFLWSYFISTQVDKSAPLLAKILPYGDYALGSQSNETFRDPVKLIFNTLMRVSTLQPGWGYGEEKDAAAWNTRYIVLKTITSGANAVGYWVSSLNLDEGDSNGAGRGDGLADYTVAYVNHNSFDQAVSYGPLVGNGVESITQNCFLPGNGPINAGADNPAHACVYNADGTTQGCVTDASISSANRVTSTNPSSYGYQNCTSIDGAVRCSGSCKTHYATSSDSANGSWIITKDNPAVTNAATGATGCCFGKCF